MAPNPDQAVGGSTIPYKRTAVEAMLDKEAMANTEYTVGWIAALPHERAAAEAMLDKEHEPPQHKHKNDDNIYNLGSINGPNGHQHNVVITSLPSGRYGTTPAATAATHLLSSFPSIKFGLIVGIGGGIPNDDNDIRLGDVVVSRPEGTFGGVRQYDCGKTTSRGFEERGSLNSPPRVLLNAVSAVESKYEKRGSAIPSILQIMYENYPLMFTPRTGPGYVYQGVKNDHLFHPDYGHLSTKKDCSVCDKAKEVLRPERSDFDPYIHYGTIASGNKVIKDARKRDLMSKECLCFETEAAGLMNDFPCLVIRGICDYCDTHKNDQWQRYAAATAAAYAKELLQVTDVVDIRSTPDARRVMHEYHEEWKRHEILNWISPIDYGPQYSDILKQRHDDTGQWLLDSSHYQTWIRRKNQTLFCPGIPGAGKTVFSAIVINDLNARFQNDCNVCVAYIFCNFQRHHEQTLEQILSSLLKQLVQRQTSIPNSIKDFYAAHKVGRTKPILSEITALLQKIAAIYSKVFIVVDALDECQTTSGCRKRLLWEIFNLQATTGVNLFATSRFIQDIEKEFSGSIRCEIRASEKDVQKYLIGKLQTFPSLGLNGYYLREEIKSRITMAADGMFLLAQLYMDSLAYKTTPKEIMIALKDLERESQTQNDDKKSRALDYAYIRAMGRINAQRGEYQRLANQVLSWITCAKRPLLASELQHALAVEIGKHNLDKDNITPVEIMISVCAGLVIVDEQSEIIRLVHHTAQEYFQRTQNSWFPNAQTDITKRCITYLSFDNFEAAFCLAGDEFKAMLKSNVLYDYAAGNWGEHARMCSAEDVNLMILDFLENETKVFACSRAMMVPDIYVDHNQRRQKRAKGLHLAAYFGLVESIAVLLKGKHDANTKDTYGRTPLSWAAWKGQEAAAKLLLENGAELYSKDKHSRTPLSWAADMGNKAVVKLLLENGADNLESTDKYHQTPLSLAAQNGNEEVVKMLLDKGAYLETKASLDMTPLLYAAWNGLEGVVKLLLDNGANIEYKDQYGRTSLWLGVRMRREAVVKLLLDKGVNIESRDKDYNETPLSWTAREGHEALMKFLLDNGANIETKDKKYGRTPLSWAAENGHEGVAKLLLDNGADLESKDREYGQTPLSWASENGHPAVVKLLVDKGADLESKDREYGRAPLSWAAENGHQEVVKLLVDKGADLESKDKLFGQTTLSWAAQKGNEAVVNLLLGKGANLESKDEQGWTPLSLAAGNKHKEVAELLLGNGADVESKDKNGRTPLSWAAESGHMELVKLLLDNSADGEAKDDYGQTSSSWAAESGHMEVVKLLLDNGADVESVQSDATVVGCE